MHAFFGVYDGHGGRGVAEFVARSLHNRLVRDSHYANNLYPEAFKNTFIELDKEMYLTLPKKDHKSGCAANCILVTDDNRIFVANAGDCRSVLSVMGRARILSKDHKPDDDRLWTVFHSILCG